MPVYFACVLCAYITAQQIVGRGWLPSDLLVCLLCRRSLVSLVVHLASLALWPGYSKTLRPTERRQWCNKIACGLHVSTVAIAVAIAHKCRLQLGAGCCCQRPC
jgi:hypothetical protein